MATTRETLEEQMRAAAEACDFERAARLRDELRAIRDADAASERGEIFFGYSIGPNGRMIVSLLDAPRYIGRDALVEVELDNGEVIHATLDHEFMRRDGRLAAAADLRPGDSLMPLYRHLWRGYEMTYQPLNGHLYIFSYLNHKSIAF